MPIIQSSYDRRYHVWHNEGEQLAYWVSDAEGYELEAFNTRAEAVAWMEEEVRKYYEKDKPERLSGHIAQFTGAFDEYKHPGQGGQG